MIVIICALLAVGAIGFTLLVRERDIPPAPVENPKLKHLETRRQVLYENLRDLQFEFLQGKLSEADYQSLKAGFLNDLAGVMAAMEQLQSTQEKTDGHGAKRQIDVGSEARRKLHREKELAGKKVIVAETTAQHRSTSGDHRGLLSCSACGAENPMQNRFCGQCGATLPEKK